MTISSLPPLLLVPAVMVMAAAILFPMNYAAQWLWRNLDRAGVVYSFLVIVVGGTALLLVRVGALPDPVLIPVAVLAAVAAGYGWVRYRRSPYLQRWEATHRRFDKVFATNPDAAEQLIVKALDEDDAERERLRAMAPNDHRAALMFLDLIRHQLERASRSNAPISLADPGAAARQRRLSLIGAGRRQGLEADLAWVQTILAHQSRAV